MIYRKIKATALGLFCLFAFNSAHAMLITTGSVTNNGGGSYTLSTGGSTVSDSAIESFLGLTAGTLDGISTGDATSGSAIKDAVIVQAGDTYNFDWFWSTSESPGYTFNDFSFASLSLDGVTVLANTFTANPSAGTFDWTATSSGLLTYGIGILDVGDYIFSSTLKVSNISVTSGPTNVPEPGSLALLGLGLVSMVAVRRKKV